MATFDKLPADQRAIIELVLKRGQTYEELSEMLGMTEGRVRDLARNALFELAPRSAERVDEDWRGQVADYLLRQQSGPESTATKGHLKRSEAARSWAYSLLDSLDHLYENGSQPAIPDADPGPARRARPASGTRERERERERPAKPREERPSKPLSPEGEAVVRRRRLLAAVGALAAVIAAVLVVFVWSPWSGDDDDKGGDDQAQPANQARVVTRVVLRPTRRAERDSAGIAVVGEQENQLSLVVTAQLPRNRRNEAYEVWLYNSREDAVSLGAQQTDAAGIYQGAGPLPQDYERYKYFDVSLEKIDRNAAHSGQSVLRGEIATGTTDGGTTQTDPQPDVVAP